MKDNQESGLSPANFVRLQRYDYSPDIFKAAVVFTESPYVPQAVLEDAVHNNFKKKSEEKIHVTLLPDELFEALDENTANSLASELKKVCQEHTLLELSSELYIVNKPKTVVVDGADVEYPRESIVAPLREDSEFVQAANAIYSMYGLRTDEYPFLHITLFTKPNNKYADMGIGIPSQRAWNELGPDYHGSL